ncbi:hypothetical protein ACWDRB_57620 [Nonomuraea sp. NPDC003707]
MSPKRIGAIVYDGADPADDPRWHTPRPSTRYCCGIACLQMVLDHRDGHASPLLEPLRGCRAHGGYVESVRTVTA